MQPEASDYQMGNWVRYWRNTTAPKRIFVGHPSKKERKLISVKISNYIFFWLRSSVVYSSFSEQMVFFAFYLIASMWELRRPNFTPFSHKQQPFSLPLPCNLLIFPSWCGKWRVVQAAIHRKNLANNSPPPFFTHLLFPFFPPSFSSSSLQILMEIFRRLLSPSKFTGISGWFSWSRNKHFSATLFPSPPSPCISSTHASI